MFTPTANQRQPYDVSQYVSRGAIGALPSTRLELGPSPAARLPSHGPISSTQTHDSGAREARASTRDPLTPRYLYPDAFPSTASDRCRCEAASRPLPMRALRVQSCVPSCSRWVVVLGFFGVVVASLLGTGASQHCIAMSSKKRKMLGVSATWTGERPSDKTRCPEFTPSNQVDERKVV